MEFSKTVLRHVYIDVNIKDYMLDEIYLYEVEYKSDKTFRNSEKIFSQPKVEETADGECDFCSENVEEVDLGGLFLDKMADYRLSGIPTKFFAINAKEVMLNLIEPLKVANLKAKRLFDEIAGENLPHEWLTDCLSMVRVIPMTDFDEKPELTSAIRRRLKEKFHEVANEIKRVKENHIFTRYEILPTGPELCFCVTDANINIVEDIRLHGRISDDVMISKACDIIKKYPDADIIADKTSIRLYTLFKNTSMFFRERYFEVVYSMDSMFTALGKKGIETVPENFRDYVKNAEELRFGRYDDKVIYSIHTFRLPLSYNTEEAWNKNFVNNSMWRQASSDNSVFYLIGDVDNKKNTDKKNQVPEEIYGKLSVEKEAERFVLKINKVSVKKYLPGYAVVSVQAENHFYPGKADMERINDLCSNLWCSKYFGDNYPEVLNLQMRITGKTYAISATVRDDDNNEPWLGLLLTMGRKKKNKGSKRFVVDTLSSKMFPSMDDGDIKREENASDDALCKCLVKSEYLLQLEQALAKVITPDKYCIGKITSRQKKNVKRISVAFAYMVGSYCYKEEQGEFSGVYKHVDKIRKIRETEDRIERKLDLLYE